MLSSRSESCHVSSTRLIAHSYRLESDEESALVINSKPTLLYEFNEASFARYRGYWETDINDPAAMQSVVRVDTY